jgi:hypothetical protein
MLGTQESDPRNAAAAIDEAPGAESTPLRLQLGGDWVSATEVRSHAEALLVDMSG